MYNKNILIVDDEEDNIVLLREILLMEGYENIFSASCASEAEEILCMDANSSRRTDIDLVLLDVMMPITSGFELCRKIKNKYRFLPVILVTAMESVESQVEGIEAGADDFISKPVSVTKLLARTKSLLELKSMNEKLISNYRNLKEVHESLPLYIRKKSDQIDDYKILETLGQGAMGVVYRVLKENSEKEFALKIMSESVVNKAKNIALFRSEIENLMKLDHKNIVKLFTNGVYKGFPYYVMEFYNPLTLDKLRKKNPDGIETSTAIAICLQITAALKHVHDHGVIHRDFKLDNCLIDKNGTVKLTDFGLSITATFNKAESTLIGTPQYLAPEIFNGFKQSKASDIYAFGIGCFAIFTGELPYGNISNSDLMHAHCHQPIPKLEEVCPNIPLKVAEIINQCLSKNPSKRPSDFEEIHEVFRAYGFSYG